MQRKAAIVVDNGVAGVRSALEADDHIGLLGQQIGDLALSLVAPVRAYDCFYHTVTSTSRDSQPQCMRICLIRSQNSAYIIPLFFLRRKLFFKAVPKEKCRITIHLGQVKKKDEG